MKTGIGLRAKYYDEVIKNKPRIPWFEVITENYLGAGGRPYFVLESVRKNYPVAFHGVGLSIGSQDPLRREYLAGLKDLINNFSPFLVSDHLSWSRHSGHNSHDLLPIEYTQKMLKHVTARVLQVQDYIQRPLYLENPSMYVMSRANEMRESEFLKELSQRTGCGVMLDVNNLVVNKHNLNIDYDEYLADITDLDIRQFHVAGHSLGDRLRIDTHDHPPDAETIMLLKKAWALWPTALPLIEWDDQLPELSALMNIAFEIDQMSQSISHQRELPPLEIHTRPESRENENRIAPLIWPYIFSPQGLAAHASEIENNFFTHSAPAVAGMSVYNSGYYLRALSVLKNIYPKLAYVCGDLFDDVIRKYLMAYKSTEDSIDTIGDSLPDFLLTAELPPHLGAEPQVLSDLARLEKSRKDVFWAPDTTSITTEVLAQFKPEDWSQKKLQLKPSVKCLELEYDVSETFKIIEDHKTPPPPTHRPNSLLVFRAGLTIKSRSLTNTAGLILKKLSAPTAAIYFIENENMAPQELLALLIFNAEHLLIFNQEST